MKKKENNKKEYIQEILKLFPKVSSGRKNYSDHQKRIDEIFKQINIYKKNKGNEKN
tara:strand:- start:147 stop:314 length:168 start_codon:yes stop_codon:yes gene_type:complete